MPQVFDNDMTAHVWAQRSQESGRSHNGNLNFSGPVIRSYSTPIAHIVRDVTGRDVALIASETYSVTTNGKHMPAVHRAVLGMDSFRVPYLALDYAQNSGRALTWIPLPEQHTRNLAHLVEVYRAEVARLSRMRDNPADPANVDYGRSGNRYHNRLGTLADNVENYASAFGLDAPELDVDSDWVELQRIRAERAARNDTPAKRAKREREAARRAERERERERLERAEKVERVQAWRLGVLETRHLRRGERGDAQNNAFLRVRGTTLETSQGASVPLSHAIRVFHLVAKCREEGRTYEPSVLDRAERVGHFTISRINADGSFRAGCHTFTWDEVERAAIMAGVIPAPSPVAS